MATHSVASGLDRHGMGGATSLLHPIALRAMALLATTGASVGLFVQGVRLGGTYTAFAASNEGGRAVRLGFSLAIAIGVALPVLWAVLAYLRRPVLAREAVPRVADLLSPLLVTGLLPALFS